MEEYDAIIDKKNASYFLFVPTYNTLAERVYKGFSWFVEGYKFMPQYKNTPWDGKIYFYKISTCEMPLGFWEILHEKIRNDNLNVWYNWKWRERDIKKSVIDEFIKVFSPFELRDYQRDAFYWGLRKRRLSIEIPTSGGKTVLIYLFSRWFFNASKKVLVIVPRIQLVEQSYEEFYEWDNEWTERNVLKVHGGEDWREKINDYKVIISTWQSLHKKDKRFFKNFDALIVDEAHSSKANVLRKICEKCVNAWDRIGLSGTYPSKKWSDYWSIVASIGPVKRFTTYKKMVENDWIADFSIVSLILIYPEEFEKVVERLWKTYMDFKKPLREHVQKIMRYNFEVELQMYSYLRYLFLRDLAKKLKKNSIFLFTRREHGKLLYSFLKEALKDKEVYYIDGTVKVDEREFFKQRMEESDNVVIVASYGTFSEGINIKNLHNIVFCSGYKSKIKVLQSIGRVLRKYSNKHAKIYDIVDYIRFGGRKYNILMNHFFKRKEYYERYDMNFSIKKINLGKWVDQVRDESGEYVWFVKKINMEEK